LHENSYHKKFKQMGTTNDATQLHQVNNHCMGGRIQNSLKNLDKNFTWKQVMGLCLIVAHIPLWPHAIKYFQLKRKRIYTFKLNEWINTCQKKCRFRTHFTTPKLHIQNLFFLNQPLSLSFAKIHGSQSQLLTSQQSNHEKRMEEYRIS
jgi:hypothetical protein